MIPFPTCLRHSHITSGCKWSLSYPDSDEQAFLLLFLPDGQYSHLRGAMARRKSTVAPHSKY
ncbi:hypothetical protein MESS4_830492 [Mesorhizobium sp. STM 4661]|nr:hypothetical protein MESS4_830492 [Mesorhizobium sp. STM 4661]